MEAIASKLASVLAVSLLFAAAITPAVAQTRDDMVVKGEAIANKDPLALELRNRQPNGTVRRGFDIGMAAAEGQTLPGPSKQALHDSLGLGEREGFATAVSFSLDRNRNAAAAATGAAIAEVDSSVASARTADRNVLYWLGFDIATGIFGDRAHGGLGNTATGPGSLKIRDALSAPAQKGFNASVVFHLRLEPVGGLANQKRTCLESAAIASASDPKIRSLSTNPACPDSAAEALKKEGQISR